MSTIRFEIRHTDGRIETATVEGERALIGHAAHCDVRLPLDQAAAEHIAVEVVGDTVRVETKAFEPAATINGMPFTAMPISADMALSVGTTRIFITLTDVGNKRTGSVAQRSEDSGSPLIRVLGLVGVAAGVYVFLPAAEVHPMAPLDVPQLFAGPAATCEQKAPDQAHAQALSLLDYAETERERSPFVARDGLQAVQLYEVAAACFRQAGTSEAEGAQHAADELKDTIALDFRARRVRLEHMLAVGDLEMAGKDVAVLRELTVGRRGPWISWLASTDQMLKQKGVGK